MRLKTRYAIKLATLVVTVVLLISSIYFFQHTRTTAELRDRSSFAMTRALLRESRNAGKAFTLALASSLFEPLALDDFEQMSNITSSVRDLPNVSAINVFDVNGNIINDGTATISSFGKPIDASIRTKVLDEGILSALQKDDEIAIAAPIKVGERTIGGIELQLRIDDALANIDDLNQELHGIVQRNSRRDIGYAILIAIGLSLAGAVMGIALAYRLTGPIVALNTQSRRIAQGHYDIDLPPTRNDELGELATSFRSMAHELEATTVSKSELESLVRQRTQELEDANTQLREVDSARRVFLSDMSHELRTPLTAIRGTAEVALRNRDHTHHGLREALERVVTLSQQFASLVNDFMFIARSESGVIDLKKEWMILEEPLAEAMRAVRAMWPQANLKLERDEAAEACVVTGDQQRLRQLFTILLDNAVKYSEDRQPVKIELRRLKQSTGEPEYKQPGEYAQVRIIDRGIGMTESESRRIFDRFFRSTRAREMQGGMGLGLAIANTIARAHDANLDVESKVGNGTVFTFKINITSDDDSATGPNDTTIHDQSDRQISVSGGTSGSRPN